MEPNNKEEAKCDGNQTVQRCVIYVIGERGEKGEGESGASTWMIGGSEWEEAWSEDVGVSGSVGRGGPRGRELPHLRGFLISHSSFTHSSVKPHNPRL